MGIAIGAAEKHVCVAAADGRFGNRYQVVLTRGEIAADYAVMNDIIDPASKTGKEVVGNGGCRDDRFGVVGLCTYSRMWEASPTPNSRSDTICCVVRA
jgi:hypothetical protein